MYIVSYFFRDRYPYFKAEDDRWKNSVRHNLSMNPHFRKGDKSKHGAGHLWVMADYDDSDPDDPGAVGPGQQVRTGHGNNFGNAWIYSATLNLVFKIEEMRSKWNRQFYWKLAGYFFTFFLLLFTIDSSTKTMPKA